MPAKAATVADKAIAKVTARLAPTIGSLADEIWALREDKRALETQVKAVEDEIDAKEEALMALLDAQGTRKGEGKRASVAITEAVSATVEDWDALWPYITKHKYFHLVQKRVSDVAMRELWDQGKKVPGVQPFTKRKINVRTLSS